MSQLSKRDIITLVDLLLACPSIQDKHIRDNGVLRFLNDELRHAIPRHGQDRADVVNIVETCNDYPGALGLLIEGVRCFEKNSHPFQKLEQFWKRCQQTKSSQEIRRIIHKTDFRKTFNQFQKMMRQFNRYADAALYILQKGNVMGAHLIVERMRQELGIQDYHRCIEIDLIPGTQRGVHGILQRLAETYQVQKSSSTHEQWIMDIIQTICGSFQTGSILFMQVKGWDDIRCRDNVLCEFVEQFWARLVQEICKFQTPSAQGIDTTHDICRVRVITVMITDMEISAPVLKSLRKSMEQRNIVAPKPEYWSIEVIHDCIAEICPLPRSEIDILAHTAHQASERGKPTLAANWLFNRFDSSLGAK